MGKAADGLSSECLLYLFLKHRQDQLLLCFQLHECRCSLQKQKHGWPSLSCQPDGDLPAVVWETYHVSPSMHHPATRPSAPERLCRICEQRQYQSLLVSVSTSTQKSSFANQQHGSLQSSDKRRLSKACSIQTPQMMLMHSPGLKFLVWIFIFPMIHCQILRQVSIGPDGPNLV